MSKAESSTLAGTGLPSDLTFGGSSSEPPWAVVKACACVSQLAYQDPGTIDQWAARWQVGIDTIDVGGFDVQALLVEGHGHALVSYRGTQPSVARDWLDDLEFEHEPGPFGGEVHRGFHRSVLSAWQPVEAFARRASGNRHALWVTGHSLGAAMATLAAARLCEKGLAPQGVVNFGSPRVGDKRFAQGYDRHLGVDTWRMVNHADIVTRVPPRSLGYTHVGRIVHFDAAGAWTDDGGSWGQFLDRLNGPVADLLRWGKEGLTDHLMDNYLRLVLAE